MKPLILFAALVVLIRVPFRHHPVQGDDFFYLAEAQHALVEPLHPNHFRLVSQGVEVDMRGFPHPPGNAWFLAGLLALLGDVQELPFHAFYALFSFGAVAAVWALAKRFCLRPVWGTLLFIATPAFVINGNSLESDVPFLAFWLGSVALFVEAVEHRRVHYLALSGCAMAVTAMISYQAVVIIPILAFYMWTKDRAWKTGWVAILTPPLVVAGWQLYEFASTGAAGAQVMSGYFDSYGLQRLELKLRNAVALTVHLGWMVSPLFAPRFFAVGLLGALYDWSPLFWLPLGIGLASLAAYRKIRFLNAWLYIFFAAVLAIGFAGSARYLLPLAAPLAFLTVNRLYHRDLLLGLGFVTQLALSLTLAVSNCIHWDEYRWIVEEMKPQFKEHRVFVNSEWGLRYYAESEGAVRLKRGETLRAGDLVISSAMSDLAVAGQAISRHEVKWPVQLFGVKSPSAYSYSSTGFRAFDVSWDPIDTVTVSVGRERKPTRSYVPMNAADADEHIVSGVDKLEANAWRWTSQRAVFVLKPTGEAMALEAEFRVPDQMLNRRVTLWLDGVVVAEQSYAQAGVQKLRSKPVKPVGESAAVTLSVDQAFRVPGDSRDLALILMAIGFVP